MEFFKPEILLHVVLEVGSRAEQSLSAAAKVPEMHGDRAFVSLKGSGLSSPCGNLTERMLA